MRSLDDVLEGKAADEQVESEQVQQAAPAEVVEPAAAEMPQGDTLASPPADGAPPAPENDDEDKPLPAHVVKAIRGERNDWKEKALIAQAKLEERERLEKQQQQSAAPSNGAPQAEMSPQEQFEHRMFIERSNMSQFVAKQTYPDLDDKVSFFVEQAKGNPALINEMRNHPHPYEFAYKTAVKLQALAEIGDDPAAYRARLADQIRAELSQQPAATGAAPAAPRAPLPPTSLATARSAAPRDSDAWTGPTPLENIIKRG